MLDKNDPGMQKLVNEIVSGLAEWRQQNPKATFGEIEQETMKRMGQLQARMMQEMAMESKARDWEPGSEPICPECGEKMKKRSEQERRLQTQGGGEVVLKRAYAICPRCGAEIFPLDEELALIPGSLTPLMHESLVRLGAWMPFGRDTEFMKEMLGVSVSKSMSVRATEAAGAAYVSLETEEADRIEKEAPKAVGGVEKMVMSADGAMVPLVGGEWAEVKTLVIGEVGPKVKAKDEWVVHTQRLSYFSRLVDAEKFQHLSLVEVQRRGIEHSQEVAMLGDGSEWIQHLADYHRKEALRILDFPHGGQRIGEIGQVIWGVDTEESAQWVTNKLHQLKHEGPIQLLTELVALQNQHPGLEVLENNLAYLKKREAHMRYPLFLEQGWPIASSIVESANKLVVEARLKGAGMHWQRQHVDPMLALRNIICSDRWKEEWPRITKQLRSQKTQRRKLLREKHRQANQPVSLQLPSSLPSKPDTQNPVMEIPSPDKPELSATTQESQQPWRPASNHPWRNSPIGKARYHSNPFAKN